MYYNKVGFLAVADGDSSSVARRVFSGPPSKWRTARRNMMERGINMQMRGRLMKITSALLRHPTSEGRRQNDGLESDHNHTRMAGWSSGRLSVDGKPMKDALKWLLTISVIGFWFGLWHFVGWDVARTLMPFALNALGK